MKYTGKWYQVWLRWIQVKYYILTKRYISVPNGVNFYADKKLGGVGTKGYYWKPMSYTTPMVDMSAVNVDDMLKALDGIQIQFRKGD
jgi:hypothetical protein